MPRVLNRNDVVGKKIAAVLQGPIDADPDGFSGCEAFVRLEDGTTFELIWPEDNLCAVDDRRANVAQRAEVLGDDQTCIGDTVVEVLRSVYWPSIGLVLKTGRVLIQSDDFSPRNVRPCLCRLGEKYTVDDVTPFWRDA